MTRQLSVLIVDDVSSSRRIIRRHLGQLGITSVLEASSGEEALSLLASPQQIELLITDLNLGGMSGIELINSLGNYDNRRELPSIVISADADRSEVLRSIRHVVAGFLLKPFNSSDLEEKIAEVFSSRPAI